MPSSRSSSPSSSSSESDDEDSRRRRRSYDIKEKEDVNVKEEPVSPKNGNGNVQRRDRRDYRRDYNRRYDDRRDGRDQRDRDGRDRRDYSDRGRYDRHRDDNRRDDYRNRDRDRDSRREREDGRERASEPSRNEGEDGSEPTTASTTTVAPTPKPTPKAATTTRTGGVYVPPFKLAQMQKNLEDKDGAEYQRMTWDALKKSINGLINKINVSNIKNIIPEIFAENVIRGRGLFCRSLMRAQAASTNFTHVYAGLVAVVNTKFPQVGELLLHRLIDQFRKAFRRNIKPICIASTKFIAHLLNQKVCSEVLGLQLLMLLLEKPSDDSVEVAVSFLRESGKMLQDLHPQGFNLIFERFRSILHNGNIDERVQFLIEALFADRKKDFADYPSVLEDLDLVDEEDQITHELSLDDDVEIEEKLNYFNHDPDYQLNEMKYDLLKKEILGSDDEDDGEDEDGSGSSDDSSDEEESTAQQEAKQQIIDDTETELVNLRRTIYLTIMSSLDFEECGHKLMKLKSIDGHENEISNMLVECCSQERTYLRFYGLLAQRFCNINQIYRHHFEQAFVQQYSTIHRLETNKLRNVAKFFAHLFHTDALLWNVLFYIRLNEQETTSSSRIFIKILFQEIAEYVGLLKLNERLKDPEMAEAYSGIMPRDNPRNTRFAINFFTSIGLGGLTDDLREHLRNAPKQIMQAAALKKEESDSDSSSSSDSDSDSSDSDTSDSDSDSSSSSSSSSDSSPSPPRKRSRR